MPNIVNGIPQPRIVLKRNGIVVDDFTLENFESGSDALEYLAFEEDLLEHTLWSRSVVSHLRGFRMKASIYWPHGIADELIKMKNLFDRRAYDTIIFYPYAEDKPFFSEIMKLTNDPRTLSYSYHLAHHDFTLTMESVNLVDYIPLEEPVFRTWGNITLRFRDLDTLPFASYMRQVTQSNSTDGTVRAETEGYFQKLLTESVGGSLDGPGTFKTDVGTRVTFTAIPDPGNMLAYWVINGQGVAGTEVMSLIVLNDLTIQPIFDGIS